MINAQELANNMVITTFIYRLHPDILFKRLVGKPPKARNKSLERVHCFMKQEEAASEKIKSDQGDRMFSKKDTCVPYFKQLNQESQRYGTTCQ